MTWKFICSGAAMSKAPSPRRLFIDQTGLERRLYNWAHDQPFGYGLAAVVMALIMGWLSSRACSAGPA